MSDSAPHQHTRAPDLLHNAYANRSIYRLQSTRANCATTRPLTIDYQALVNQHDHTGPVTTCSGRNHAQPDFHC